MGFREKKKYLLTLWNIPTFSRKKWQWLARSEMNFPGGKNSVGMVIGRGKHEHTCPLPGLRSGMAALRSQVCVIKATWVWEAGICTQGDRRPCWLGLFQLNTNSPRSQKAQMLQSNANRNSWKEWTPAKGHWLIRTASVGRSGNVAGLEVSFLVLTSWITTPWLLPCWTNILWLIPKTLGVYEF